MITGIEKDIKENIKGKVLHDEPMAKHTSFCIGGPADIWVEPADIDDLKNCIRLSRERNIPLFIIGSGTNLLVKDEGIRGIVVNMFTHSLKKIDCDERGVSATSSISLKELLSFCLMKGFGGLEFLSGIPGTVGGAVVTNAGARHYHAREKWHSIGDFIEGIKIMDHSGEIVTLDKKDLNFGYRESNLSGTMLLEVRFALSRASQEDILNGYRKFLEIKKKTQELGIPSSGCIFKNPPDCEKTAAQLIDECGLKDARIGGAAVSRKHANYIINTGRAHSKSVIALIDMISLKIKEKFGIELSLEINIV